MDGGMILEEIYHTAWGRREEKCQQVFMIPEEGHFSQHYVYLIPLIWCCLGITGSRMWSWGSSKRLLCNALFMSTLRLVATWGFLTCKSEQQRCPVRVALKCWLGCLGICECFTSLSQNLGTHVSSNTYCGRCEVNEEIRVPNVQHISSGQKRGPECLWLNEPIKQSIWSVLCLCSSVLLHMVKICTAGLGREVHPQLYVILCTWKSVLFPPTFFFKLWFNLSFVREKTLKLLIQWEEGQREFFHNHHTSNKLELVYLLNKEQYFPCSYTLSASISYCMLSAARY